MTKAFSTVLALGMLAGCGGGQAAPPSAPEGASSAPSAVSAPVTVEPPASTGAPAPVATPGQPGASEAPGKEPPVCVQARAHKGDPTLYGTLSKQCRAAGGTP